MKLQQLEFIQAVARNGLNVSTAAEKLYTSQPGVSRQIRMLEEELGVQIFERSGRQLTRITPVGEEILRQADDILERIYGIRRVVEGSGESVRGRFSIVTTPTQSRHLLPEHLARLARDCPDLRISVYQGTPEQIAEQVATSAADIGIATEGFEHFSGLVLLPCYFWSRVVLVPEGHELAGVRDGELQLEQLAAWPLITYDFGLSGYSQISTAFLQQGIRVQVPITAVDADVIKACVQHNLGLGIVARMAFDVDAPGGLVALDASHLFGRSQTQVVLRRGSHLMDYMYHFIAGLAPHLTQELIDQAMEMAWHGDTEGQYRLFQGLALPAR